MNDTFLRACKGQETDYTPIWIMRQAGRYLPAYHTVRDKVSFLELCKTPELAAEVSIQPVDIIGVDAAIMFSDILVPIEKMGAPLEFREKQGPVFPSPIRDQAAVDRLGIPDPEDDLGYVMETVRILRRELKDKVPLIGFSGAPFTLATYLIEGGSSRNFLNTKMMMYNAPELSHSLMAKITECTATYLKGQIAAGVQTVQIFDSWVGVLSPPDFAEFALPYVSRIIKEIKEVSDIPVIYFANNGATLIDQSLTSGADVLGIDWRVNLSSVVKTVAGRAAVQGNMDPLALFLPPDKLEKRIADVLREAKGAKGHIFNLGHGIVPQTDPEKARLTVELVHKLSRRDK